MQEQNPSIQLAFQNFVGASENLRTTIIEHDANPLQYTDFSAEVNPQLAFESWLDERRSQVFELEEQLFDSVLLKLNGKIDVAALPPFEQNSEKPKSNYEAPTSDVEETLVDIWQTVLDVPRIGILDNFFDLGGHSLSAIRIVSEDDDV